MAIVLGEAEGDACMTVLEAETKVLISAGTLAEAIIFAGRRAVGEEITSLIGRLGFEIVSVTPAAAQRIAADALWGRDVHPAG
jgi:ribonuclease VapC